MLLFERLMPDTWWCARGVQVLCVSSFFPEGGFWLSVHIATQFIFYCLSESAWVWTDRLWKPKASGISYFAIRTENVLYPTRCTYATLHVTNGRQRETQKVPSNDVYLGDAQRCCRNSKDFLFLFLKENKTFKSYEVVGRPSVYFAFAAVSNLLFWRFTVCLCCCLSLFFCLFCSPD